MKCLAFYDFLAESIEKDMKKYGLKKKDVDAAIKSVAKREKVDPNYLMLFAIDDPLNKIMLYFNIADPNHKNYKSTITHTM